MKISFKYFHKAVDLCLGLVVLIGFQYLGDLFKNLFALSIPGVILGMLLFFTGLLIIGKVPQFLSSCTDTLLPLLPLFILPSFLGIMAHQDLLSRDALALLIAITVGLILTQLLIPWLFLFLLKHFNPEQKKLP